LITTPKRTAAQDLLIPHCIESSGTRLNRNLEETWTTP
jgi:hypothetical protein